jgi:cytochrome c553
MEVIFMNNHSKNNRPLVQKLSYPISGFLAYNLLLLLFCAFDGSVFASDSLGLDMLMGGQGRVNHEQRINNMVFENGRTYSWEDFSGWGKEIFLNGFVQNPPTGLSPSRPVSKLYKCITCHNIEREDPDLTVQDPEARFQWIEKTGKDIFLIQGTTVWGVVNRETFYPDDFSKYHDLCVPKGKELASWLPCGPLLGMCMPGCRTMTPDSLEDAAQVCSAYCSVGRYLKEWELYALLAFFRDQEIKLDDLDLSPEQAAQAKAVLTSHSSDPQEIERMRTLLVSKYSKKANNTFRGMPKIVTDNGSVVVEYEDSTQFTGNPDRGKRVWKVSCARCHDTKEHPLNAKQAKHLTEDLEEFHEMLAKGTRHSFMRYMPNFTLERLSRQQAADILMYLKQF